MTLEELYDIIKNIPDYDRKYIELELILHTDYDEYYSDLELVSLNRNNLTLSSNNLNQDTYSKLNEIDFLEEDKINLQEAINVLNNKINRINKILYS